MIELSEIEANDLLGFLPERERSAIKCRYWHKKNLQTVGLVLGVSTTYARRLIKKGERRLKELMVGENVHVSLRIKAPRINRKKTKPRQPANLLDVLCRAFLNGEIKTQTEIAKKMGLTRACISRRVCQMREKLELPPTQKQIAARKMCRLRQMMVAQTRKMRRTTTDVIEIWRINHD